MVHCGEEHIEHLLHVVGRSSLNKYDVVVFILCLRILNYCYALGRWRVCSATKTKQQDILDLHPTEMRKHKLICTKCDRTGSESTADHFFLNYFSLAMRNNGAHL